MSNSMNRPAFIMMVGLPGSGKTTWAEKFTSTFSGGSITHISSDSIRGELYGDPNIQGDPSEVFSIMHNRTLIALDRGFNVIYDATNVTRKDRSYILDKLPAYVRTECIIVWAPIETCIERDAKR